MYTITKEFHFEAAHHLYGLPEGHQCARMHGHSYRVEVELASPKLNRVGFVVDYGELDVFATYLKENFDHQDLNFVLQRLSKIQNMWYNATGGDGMYNPTAENLARGFYLWCKQHWKETIAVRVSETQKTWAEHRP